MKKISDIEEYFLSGFTLERPSSNLLWNAALSVIFVSGMKKFVIIHGTKGSPEGNWFPWLADFLRQQHAEVVVPRMPTPEG
jgi:hypothetical protein